MLTFYPAGSASSAVWFDLCEPTAEEAEQVRSATGLRVPTRHDIDEIESTSRLSFSGGAYYLSAPVTAGASIGFVLSARALITVRYIAMSDVAPPAELKSAEDAFLHVIERIIDRAADDLEHAGTDCDDLSHRAFEHKAKGDTLSAALRRIGAVADRTSRIRDKLLGLGRISSYVMESGHPGAPAVSPARLKAIRADVASLTDYEAHLSSKVQFLLDATLGFINIEQNEIVKTLTIASVVGIPPVLIAGIYGMNFHVMPELSWPWGYPFALGLIVVTALLPLVWFKRRGWM
jgi:magnesium transporter